MPSLMDFSNPSGFTTGISDGAGPLDQTLDAGVAGREALDQVVGELHRVLARRPLPGVVQAHEHERRALVGGGVGGVDAGGDLDAVDRLALDALVGQLEQLHEAGVVGGERLHLGVVVLERAVVRVAGGERRAVHGGGVGAVRCLDLRLPLDQVGDANLVGQVERAEQDQVRRRVQDHLDVVVSGVLGDVESAVGDDVALLQVGRDRDQLGNEGVLHGVAGRPGELAEQVGVGDGDRRQDQAGGEAGSERHPAPWTRQVHVGSSVVSPGNGARSPFPPARGFDGRAPTSCARATRHRTCSRLQGNG